MIFNNVLLYCDTVTWNNSSKSKPLNGGTCTVADFKIIQSLKLFSILKGDAERANGRVPIAMMDREKAHELPQKQVEFMQGICLPCYEIIAEIIPETAELLERCQ